MQALPPLWHEHYSATSLRAPKVASKRGKGKGCSLVGVPALTELCAHGTTAPILALTHATKNALKVTTGMLRVFLKFISNHILTLAFHCFVTFHLRRIKVQPPICFSQRSFETGIGVVKNLHTKGFALV